MNNVSTLNQGQEAVAEAFFQFLFSEDKEMGISGPPGVGKSHLMGHLIDVIMPRYLDACDLTGIKPEYDEVVMTALTNKAAEVLSVATQRPVQTIYSFMNLKVKDDFSTGQSKVVQTTAWKVHERKIVFIDEGSMTDVALDNFVQAGTLNCKIIWVGDDCQMESVGGKNPIYRPGRMQWHHLTQVMRTQIPEILRLHDQLRETVKTGIFKPIQIVPGIIDHLDNNQMEAAIRQTFAQQTLDSRILCYTNKRVVAYNDYIRDLRNLPNEYTVGELLVNSSAIQLRGGMLSVEEEVEIIKLGDPESHPITSEVSLAIRMADIRTRSGITYTNVPLPSDRLHFAALIAHFKRLKQWATYYKLRNTYPDLRQRDAATVYKSQGSTYQTGYIDLGDISTCHNPNQVARMLYVALSRERQRIFLFGALAAKYGGLIY